MIKFLIYVPTVLRYNGLFFVFSDPNDIKNRRERERYAQNSEEILKRRRQTREQNKHIGVVLDGSNNVSQVLATGQSAVTQLQNITCASGAVPNSMLFNKDVLHDKTNINEDDESDWLHRNDAYQMQPISRRKTLTQLDVPENPQLSTIINVRIPEECFQQNG